MKGLESWNRGDTVKHACIFGWHRTPYTCPKWETFNPTLPFALDGSKVLILKSLKYNSHHLLLQSLRVSLAPSRNILKSLTCNKIHFRKAFQSLTYHAPLQLQFPEGTRHKEDLPRVYWLLLSPLPVPASLEDQTSGFSKIYPAHLREAPPFSSCCMLLPFLDTSVIASSRLWLCYLLFCDSSSE